MGGVWFIATLLICKCVFSFLCELLQNHTDIKYVRFILIMIVVALCVIAPILNKSKWSILPFCIDNAKFAIIFYIMGNVFNRYKIPEKLKELRKIERVVLAFVSGIILIVCTLYNNELVLMFQNQYGNYLLFYLGSFSGIFLMIIISMGVKYLRNLFLYFGDTLWFYLMQFYVLDFMISISIRVFKNHLYIGSVIVFLTTVICLIPINELMKRISSAIVNKVSS